MDFLWRVWFSRPWPVLCLAGRFFKTLLKSDPNNRLLILPCLLLMFGIIDFWFFLAVYFGFMLSKFATAQAPDVVVHGDFVAGNDARFTRISNSKSCIERSLGSWSAHLGEEQVEDLFPAERRDPLDGPITAGGVVFDGVRPELRPGPDGRYTFGGTKNG